MAVQKICACCDAVDGHEDYCRFDKFEDWGGGLYPMRGPLPRPQSEEDRIWIHCGDGQCIKLKPGNGADGWTEAGEGRIISQ